MATSFNTVDDFLQSEIQHRRPPSDKTLRRWHRFGRSGAKLIWGGEAFAVRADGRANPNQLFLDEVEDIAGKVSVELSESGFEVLDGLALFNCLSIKVVHILVLRNQRRISQFSL